MRSTNLQDNFSSEYASFFSRNMTVFSCPFWFNLSGDMAGEEAVHIKQKLPLRMYVGVNKSPQPGIHFKYFRSYSHSRDKWTQREVPEYLPFVEKWINKIQDKDSAKSGVEVSILSEVGRHTGLGINSLILFALYLARAWIDNPNILSEFASEGLQPIRIITGSETPITIHVRKFLTLIHDLPFSPDALGILSSFYEGAHPHILVGKNLYTPDQRTYFYGVSLYDILGDDIGDPYGSTETSIVYSGTPLIIEKHLQLNKRTYPAWNTAPSIIHDTLNRLDVRYSQTQLPDFLRKPEVFSKEFIGASEMMRTYQSTEVLDTLLKSYKQDHSYAVNDFLRSLNRFAMMQHYLYGQSHEMTKFFHDLWSALGECDDLPAIYPNNTAITGGCFNIISPAWKHQDAISELPSKLISHKWYATIYRSWKDGHESKGFMLEQNSTQNVYHELADKNMGICFQGDIEHVMIRSELADFSHGRIVCDFDMEKIYCDGKMLTSTQLPSQRAAIEVLRKLRLSGVGLIKNTDLTHSTYSKNKNEMQGKIVWPLNRLSLEFLWEPFPIDLNWWLEKFDIIFSPDKKSHIAFFTKS
jgi:hypothetical protein